MVRTPNPSDGAATFTTLPYSVTPWGVHHLQNEDICLIPLETSMDVQLEEMAEFVEPHEIGSPDDEVHEHESSYSPLASPARKTKAAG